MRLTAVCQANFKFDFGKYFWWGKGWVPKPDKWQVRDKEFKKLWRYEGRREVTEIKSVLPEGVEAVDANEYVREINTPKVPKYIFPWPYNQRPIKGSPSDPNYHERPALVFTRHKLLLDPLKQSLFFTNSVCEDESNYPKSVESIINLEMDDQLLNLSERRINWCMSSDSTLSKLPKKKLFPYMDQNPTRRFGIPLVRKELNIMHTYFDLSELFISKQFGFTDNTRIFYPYCVVPFEREDKLTMLNLECEFVTTSHQKYSLPLFSTTPLITIEKPLTSIQPLNWTLCFDEKNIYPSDYTFKIPPSKNIHTIYLQQNELREVKNDYLAGRALMFCYGFAVAQARLSNEGTDYKELDDPITIQCVYHNANDYTFGFVFFQLNTTSFTSEIKNQVWFDGPYHDPKTILQRFVAMQLNGFIDTTTQKIKL